MKYRIVPVSISIILCLFLLSAPVWATVVKYMEVEELAQVSAEVFHGEVLSTRVYWNPQRTRIYTAIQVKVQESFKGSARANDVLTVVQLGGERDGVLMDYAGRPEFNAGESIVLFTTRTKSGELTVVGLKQGKLAVKGDQLTRDFSGLTIIGMADAGRTSRLTAAKPARLTMSDFRSRMARIK